MPSETDTADVVAFPQRTRITKPVTRNRTQDTPAEVTELQAVWTSGDRSLDGLREQARIVAGNLLRSGLISDDARIDVLRAAGLGVEIAIREHFEKKVCGND